MAEPVASTSIQAEGQDSRVLQSVVGTALRAIREERRSTILNSTVSLFRRDRANRGVGQGKKPGRTIQFISTNFLLLSKWFDFVPPKSEQDRLTRNGLGSPKHELPGLNDNFLKKSKLRYTWNIVQLEDFIIQSYRDVPLARIGFQLGKAGKGKRIVSIQPSSMQELRASIGKSRLFIIPNREITLPLDQQTSDSETGIEHTEASQPQTAITQLQSATTTTEPQTETTQQPTEATQPQTAITQLQSATTTTEPQTETTRQPTEATQPQTEEMHLQTSTTHPLTAATQSLQIHDLPTMHRPRRNRLQRRNAAINARRNIHVWCRRVIYMFNILQKATPIEGIINESYL